ncbi:DUF922 domain-containing protein [Pontibacter ramchanderi]|uniref:Putative secreted Zn-dependent protease n=1 Tax=Pontibacter ramchanderi TaxID=1179743 RepID=A0A2N3V176_9BACT|nr:DUF922 domain-containing protein [Pontibacter ramchanderi]PKV75333.1 putative secreted Zn-dependent protease [Pontibacter ramchanderi]
MFIFTLLLSLLVGLLLPYPTPAGSPASVVSVPSTANVSLASNEHLAWSATRRLNWEDFRGTPESTNPHHALTAANLAVDARCKDNKFYYEVKCVFLPGESWSKNKQSEKLLAHEQLHFDLTEVHARLLRRELDRLGMSCGNLKTNLNTTVGNAFKAWKAEQDHFDKVSRHGLDAQVQQEWSDRISQRLKELDAWK